jgi:hypothetical protein
VLAVYGAIAAVIAARKLWPAVVLPAAIALVSAAIWSWLLLIERQPYVYTPFLTPASLVTAVTVAAWAVSSEVLMRARWNPSEAAAPGAPQSGGAPRALRFAPVLLLFLWGRTELADMVSAQVSTFALIVYYAAAGIAAVGFGRARRIAPLRHVGLAVAVYAALKAVAEASQLGIVLRVSSYLCAGVFLLSVAYWYRGEAQQG